jgi:hypothetical protein
MRHFETKIACHDTSPIDSSPHRFVCGLSAFDAISLGCSCKQLESCIKNLLTKPKMREEHLKHVESLNRNFESKEEKVGGNIFYNTATKLTGKAPRSTEVRMSTGSLKEAVRFSLREGYEESTILACRERLPLQTLSKGI